LLLAVKNPASAPPYLLQASEIDPALTDVRELAFVIQRALPFDNPAYTMMAVGRKLGSLNMWDLSVIAFRNITESQPGYGEAWAYLGEALQHLDNHPKKEVRSALAAALEVDPNSLSANIFSALFWMRNGDPDLSYQYLQVASDINPDNPDILIDLGETAAITGDLVAANAYYQKAMDVTYNRASTLQKYVEFCIRYNIDPAGTALPIARLALSNDQNNPASLDVMGQVLFRLGDLYGAERFFLRAIQIDPNYATAYKHLGLVYTLQEKNDLARDALSRADSLTQKKPTVSPSAQYFDVPTLP